MRRVALVEPHGRGGIAHYTYLLGAALAEAGAEVSLFTSDDYEFRDTPRFTIHEIFEHRGGSEARFPGRYVRKGTALFRGAGRLRAEIRASAPDVVHFQGGLPAADWLLARTVWPAASAAGAQIVFTAHNILPHESKPRHRPLYKSIYERADAVIVHGEPDACALRALAPDHRAVHVIPHGEYTLFDKLSELGRDEARQQLDLGPGDKTILFFGVIRPYKGLDTLIEAAATARERIPNLKLLIVGNPLESFAPYDELLEANGLTAATRKVLGYVPNEEVGLYFKAADIVALPYRQTYQSGVVHAAMAFGLPVAASRTGGLTELIETTGCGRLFEPGDAAALAAGLAELLDDNDLAAELGSAGRRAAESTFSWTGIARTTLDAYGDRAGEKTNKAVDLDPSENGR